MNLHYLLKDEAGNVGVRIDLIQGERKTLQLYWFELSGLPFFAADPTEITVAIFKGQGNAPLLKKLSLAKVTSLTAIDGDIGLEFELTEADTAALPVSAALSAEVIWVSAEGTFVLNLPGALNVAAPAVALS